MSHISWQNFLTILAAFLAAWYFLVGGWYFRKNILQFLSNIPHRVTRKDLSGPPRSEPNPGYSENHFNLAIELRTRIEKILRDAIEREFPKEELLFAIQICVRDFKILKETPFRIAINNYIENELNINGSVWFNEDDLNAVWMG